MQIHHIRENYTKATLTESDVLKNPIEQFKKWLEQALESEAAEPTAFTLCVSNKEQIVSGRIVLLKYIEPDGFVFFTNYNSQKGQALAQNPHAGMVFFWPELQRQVNIQGLVEKTATTISDEYFYSRPLESQVGALASLQSSVLASREELEKRLVEIEQSKAPIVRPEHWGGYIVKPTRIEFWQGRASRLHDRILFTKINGGWKIERLSP